MDISITTVPGKIGIETRPSYLTIRQPKAELYINSKSAELNIHTEHARVLIDQRQCFSEAGLKNVFELTEEHAQRAYQIAIGAIGDIVDEGNRMADFLNKTDAFAELAANKALPPPADYNIALMPISRPKIDFVGGISFNPEEAVVNIQAITHRPQISYNPGMVDIYMLQKPSININYVGKKVDIHV